MDHHDTHCWVISKPEDDGTHTPVMVVTELFEAMGWSAGQNDGVNYLYTRTPCISRDARWGFLPPRQMVIGPVVEEA